MKLHSDFRETMKAAAQSVYMKVRRCAHNDECGKKMLIVPGADEITLLHWLLEEFAEENDFEL